MQQIAEWLETLGMSEYAQRFAENGISVAALRHLTDQDLKDIGVLLGHRRIMLAAIAEFAGAPLEAPKTDSAKEPKALDTAERRQVTVMFSDLVGSTALVGSNGPGGPARDHFRLSEMRRRDCAALRWFRCEIHGRRRARVFRLPAGP